MDQLFTKENIFAYIYRRFNN